MYPNIQRFAFTVAYPGRVNVIVTKVNIKPNALVTTSGYNQIETNALWDTGATRSVISTKLVKALNLAPIGITQVQGVHGVKECYNYLVDFILPNQVTIEQVQVIESSDIPTDALVGMDIIGLGDFTISNSEDKTLFTFQIPSTHSTNYVVEINEENLKQNKPKPLKPKDVRALLNQKNKNKHR